MTQGELSVPARLQLDRETHAAETASAGERSRTSTASNQQVVGPAAEPQPSSKQLLTHFTCLRSDNTDGGLRLCVRSFRRRSNSQRETVDIFFNSVQIKKTLVVHQLSDCERGASTCFSFSVLSLVL